MLSRIFNHGIQYMPLMCIVSILADHSIVNASYFLMQITGAIFVDLSAAYDTINHRKLLHKLLEITKDSSLTKFTQTMLSNRSFYVILNGKRSKWRNQKKWPTPG